MNNLKITNEQVTINNNLIDFKAEKGSSLFEINVGEFENVKHFAAVCRDCVYWTVVKTGKSISEIPMETQWLLLEHGDNTYTVVIPLVKDKYRCAIKGSDNGLFIYCETGDDAIEIKSAQIAYIENGKNPYDIMEKAGKTIAEVLPDLKVRDEKLTPEFVKYFGWCTWDSFYDKVTEKDVKDGLEDFKKGGFVPKLVILDDGWQSVEETCENRGKHQLSSFKANEKFNHTLKPTVKMAKEDFGVKMFMVWHAVMGYWGGVYPESPEMAKYGIKLKTQNHSKALHEVAREYSEVLHFPYGFINPEKAFDFYNDYHSHLRQEGVDGLKVDVQAAIEAFGEGEGGSVNVIRSFRKGIEASANRNFNGNLINCMSCSNYHILNTLSGMVMRSSDDFFPQKPYSHGVHILNNAFSSIFMGEFLICDWDMFQTKHEFGEFHAAARSISGSPVYVSDRVGEHDFDVIDKLTMADGTLPLAKRNARPTMDSLFIDNTERNEIFKIFNYNEYTGVVGAFNLLTEGKLKKTISPCDVVGFDQGEYAVYDANSEKLLKMNYDDVLECELSPIKFNIYTVAEIKEGVAPIGLVNKYNAGGTVLNYEKNDNTVLIKVGDGGEFVIYSESEPKKVLVNGENSKYSYKENTLRIELPKGRENKVFIVF